MPLQARVEGYRASIGKASETARAWVAERDGEIVGVAVSLRESPEAVELRDLYAVPSAWGTDVASQLMDAALASVSTDASHAFLWVGEDNTRARRFYEREGWVSDGGSRQPARTNRAALPPGARLRDGIAS